MDEAKRKRLEQWKKAKAQSKAKSGSDSGNQSGTETIDQTGIGSSNDSLRVAKVSLKSLKKSTVPLKRSRIVLETESRENGAIEPGEPKMSVPTKSKFLSENVDSTALNASKFSLQEFLEVDIQEKGPDKKTAIVSSDDEEVGTERDSTLIELEKKRAKSKVKAVPVVDHANISYRPFRKGFYRQVPELDSSDVDAERSTLGIQISGSDLAPLTNWHQAGLPAQILHVLEQKQLKPPTPIQAQALPVIMAGNDILGISPTGSGKTMAFILPVCRHIVENIQDHPSVVILAPTRELASQISKELDPFARALRIEQCCATGGTSIGPQISQIKRGNVSVIVGTPGRMIDLLAANNGKILSLGETSMIVLDETDRMFDMGFEPQIKRILHGIRPDCQSVLFSATMSSFMKFIGSKILRNEQKKVVNLVVGTSSTVPPQVTQKVKVFEDPLNKFVELLSDLGKYFVDVASGALVFVASQGLADKLAVDLVNKGYRATSLHGGKAQADRDSAISDFKNGAVDVLVATSVAARGLDVTDLGLVVNYDPPNHIEDYIHRAGRTGRAGNSGTALTFLTKDQTREARDVARALAMSGADIPQPLQQLCAIKPEDKSRWGFGGKGLRQLEVARKEQRTLEGVIHGGADFETFNESAAKPAKQAKPDNGSRDGQTSGVHSSHPSDIEVTVKRGTWLARLDINDYPREARLAATNPAKQTAIAERYGVTMAGKGSFNANNKADDRLHLRIEGPTEDSVRDAYHDLSLLLTEALTRLSSATTPSGKYTV